MTREELLTHRHFTLCAMKVKIKDPKEREAQMKIWEDTVKVIDEMLKQVEVNSSPSAASTN
jgi:hypothetical protein